MQRLSKMPLNAPCAAAPRRRLPAHAALCGLELPLAFALCLSNHHAHDVRCSRLTRPARITCVTRITGFTGFTVFRRHQPG